MFLTYEAIDLLLIRIRNVYVCRQFNLKKLSILLQSSTFSTTFFHSINQYKPVTPFYINLPNHSTSSHLSELHTCMIEDRPAIISITATTQLQELVRSNLRRITEERDTERNRKEGRQETRDESKGVTGDSRPAWQWGVGWSGSSSLSACQPVSPRTLAPRQSAPCGFTPTVRAAHAHNLTALRSTRIVPSTPHVYTYA